jgi:hypothetical protein
MILQLLHSEFPYIRGQFYFLFYQCTSPMLLLFALSLVVWFIFHLGNIKCVISLKNVIIQIKGECQVCCAKIKNRFSKRTGCRVFLVVKIKPKMWIYGLCTKKIMKPHILERIPWVASFVWEETSMQHLIVDVPVLHFALHSSQIIITCSLKCSFNSFLFIKIQLLISSEVFSALEKKAVICSQRAMLPLQSGVTALCR